MTSRTLTLLLGAALCVAALWSAPVVARVGFGDPAEPFRLREPDQILVFSGHVRVRGALYSNMDLDRGPSPTTGEPLWVRGETPLDLTAGQDLRMRLAPSFFLGDEVRLFLEIGVLENVAFGSSPRGAPYGGRPALVVASAFQDPIGAADGALQVRSAGADVLTPVGVLSVGRMPSHFGLGITSNDGNDIDDDGGDRADRIAFSTPLFGHYFALAYDWAAAGPSAIETVAAPDARRLSETVQGLSAAFVRYHAPWEMDLLRRAGRLVLNYGAAASGQWQLNDAPGYYQTLEAAYPDDEGLRVQRNGYALVLDAWVRVAFGPFRLEAETVASHIYIDNPSPWPGVAVRQPITGNPFGGVVQLEYAPFDGRLSFLGETGVASSDPGYGFPLEEPTSFNGSRPGDVKGPQVDGPRDTRMDAFRFHRMYRVDLILWRTLLGGVSEAAYVRAKVGGQPLRGVTLEAAAIYSHALHPDSAPGGISPLGLETDFGAQLDLGAFSMRADYGVLFPFGGLGGRGLGAPGIAQMFLMRLGYAA